MGVPKSADPSGFGCEVGTTFSGVPIFHDFAKLSNFNHVVVGNSGSGKTYTIKMLLSQMVRQGLTCFVIDTQGDFVLEQFPRDSGVRHSDINIIRFNNRDGCSINPLEIPMDPVDPSLDLGGPYLAAKTTVEALQMLFRSIGDKQRALIEELIEGMFAEKGVLYRDAGTWSNANCDINHLIEYTERTIASAKSGLSRTILDEVDVCRKRLAQVDADLSKESSDSERLGTLQAKYEKAETEYRLKLQRMLEAELKVSTVQENRYNVGRLESLLEMLISARNSRLFCGHPAVARPGVINVFDIKDVHDSEKMVIFRLLLGRVFSNAMKTCRAMNSPHARWMLVFDEAKFFVHFSKSPVSVLNRIYTEGRKFGLGTITGVQTPTQLTADIRSVMSTLFILPLGRELYKTAKSIWDLQPAQLNQLKPKSDALYKVDNEPFYPIRLFR